MYALIIHNQISLFWFSTWLYNLHCNLCVHTRPLHIMRLHFHFSICAHLQSWRSIFDNFSHFSFRFFSWATRGSFHNFFNSFQVLEVQEVQVFTDFFSNSGNPFDIFWQPFCLFCELSTVKIRVLLEKISSQLEPCSSYFLKFLNDN